jgi:hypothetical protein
VLVPAPWVYRVLYYGAVPPAHQDGFVCGGRGARHNGHSDLIREMVDGAVGL